MINKVVLTGRCVDNLTLHATNSGKAVCSFVIANETGYGESKNTNFITVVAWQKTAEFVAKYFQKGSAIGIVGTIRTRKYEDKDGKNRTAVEVFADEVHFIESKKNNDQTEAETPQTDEFVDGIVTNEDELPF